MPSITGLLNELDEREMAQRVGLLHDEARMRYPLHSNTVYDFNEFSRAIAEYYDYHFTACVSRGGRLSLSEAAGRAKELLEKEYRRRQGDIISAFNDAHDGTNGGMRVVLDTLAEGLKTDSVERYIRDAFDRHVAPNSWEDKVEIIRQFISHCGPVLSPSVRTDQPERYAHNYQELIRAFVDGLKRASTVFRRL